MTTLFFVWIFHSVVGSLSQGVSTLPGSGELLEQDACIGMRMAEEVATNFSSRATEDVIMDKLDASIRDGLVRNCNADVVFHAIPGLSFVDMFLHLSNYLLIAAYFGASFSWSRADTYHLVWFAYFRNSLGLAAPTCRRWGHEQELFNSQAWLDKLTVHHSAYTVHLKSSIMRRLWSMRDESKKTIDSALLKAGLGNNAKFIGVDIPGLELHTRLTEEHASSNSSIVSRLRVLMKEMGITIVYAVRRGDTPAVREQASFLQQHLGMQVDVLTVTTSELNAVDAAFLPARKTPASAVSVLTVLEALRRSHVFLGWQDSNLSKLVYHLRPYNSISLKVDTQTSDFAPFAD